MKKMISLFIILVLMLSLSACTQDEVQNNYIEKAELSEEEEKILELLVDTSNDKIYDFKIDGDVKTIQISLNELEDGKWVFLSGNLEQFKDKDGRIALSFENAAEAMRIAVQSKNSSGYSSYNTEFVKELNRDDLGLSETSLYTREEIQYEKEIPLVIQTLSSEETELSYDLDSFYTPEVYEEEDYEHIYAVTIMFSKKTIDELGEDKSK